MKAKEEFAVGKHNIGWINSKFSEYFKDTDFDVRPVPTFQKLPRSMKDVEIEYELKPGYCQLGDILAFLDNAPQEYKDGWANLFYTPAFVVGVRWNSGVGAWLVGAWGRGDGEWDGGNRVFSPATGTSATSPSVLGSLETLPLELNINGIVYKKVKVYDTD